MPNGSPLELCLGPALGTIWIVSPAPTTFGLLHMHATASPRDGDALLRSLREALRGVSRLGTCAELDQSKAEARDKWLATPDLPLLRLPEPAPLDRPVLEIALGAPL